MSEGDALFVVSSAWYEKYEPTMLVGPTMGAGSFEALCARLVPEAARRAMRAKPDGFVGWREVKDQLVLVLVDPEPMRLVSPPAFGLWGSNIIRAARDDGQERLLGDALEDVNYHRLKSVAWTPSRE